MASTTSPTSKPRRARTPASRRAPTQVDAVDHAPERAVTAVPSSLTSSATGEPASKRALRKQGRRTMRKLLDAAMVVFARRGYHAARVDDIVKLAKTSHGTFYLYFSNKEDLLRALVIEAGTEVATLDQLLGPVGPDPEGWQELRAWMSRFSEAWQRYAPVIRAWTDLAMTDPELGAQAHSAAGGVSSTLAKRIAEAGPDEGIDPIAAAEAVVAMIDRFHYLRQFTGEPVDDTALDTLTTMVHRALFTGTVARKPRPRDSSATRKARQML
ncbi:MAG: TetR/AcrR family transcriptional regulator [Acidimicrobiales bacterium]